MYKELRVIDYDEEGERYEDIIRANLNYRQDTRMDFVLYKTEENDGSDDEPLPVGRTLLFFKLNMVVMY